jgi:hypothetical protein
MRVASSLIPMRAVSYILILLGLYLLATTGYDQFRGITHKPFGPVGTAQGTNHNARYLTAIPVHQDQNATLFHQFIVVHWIYAALIEGAGCLCYLKYNAQWAPAG